MIATVPKSAFFSQGIRCSSGVITAVNQMQRFLMNSNYTLNRKGDDMRRAYTLFFLSPWLFLALSPSLVLAQEKTAYPINRYVRDERGPNDYVVEFLIAKDGSWRIEASGDKEKKVLSRSTVTNRVEGNYRRIVVTAGGRARYLASYFGTIDMWANSLNVYYRR